LDVEPSAGDVSRLPKGDGEMILNATNEVTNPNGNRPQGTVIGIAIHHTVGNNLVQSEADERAVIAAIDRQHVAQGFGGFGYHGIVFPSGRAYFCGSGQRAHVARRNHELRGWVFSGTFVSELPTPEAFDGMREALLAERAQFGDVPIQGHREWALPGEGTACPGIIAPRDWDAFLVLPAPPRPAHVVYNKIGFSDGTEWYLEVKEPPL
jgi:hypothetical protein